MTCLTNIPLDGNGFTTVSTGSGTVGYSGGVLTMTPATATNPSETYGPWVVYDTPVRDFLLSVTATTVSQLRQGSSPNAWERFWLFFNYTVPVATKETNYILTKTNGLELGTAYDEVGQTFLDTPSTPTLAIGVTSTWLLRKEGNTIWFNQDGGVTYQFTGDIYDVSGKIGFYSEDAIVTVSNFKLASLD